MRTRDNPMFGNIRPMRNGPIDPLCKDDVSPVFPWSNRPLIPHSNTYTACTHNHTRELPLVQRTTGVAPGKKWETSNLWVCKEGTADRTVVPHILYCSPEISRLLEFIHHRAIATAHLGEMMAKGLAGLHFTCINSWGRGNPPSNLQHKTQIAWLENVLLR